MTPHANILEDYTACISRYVFSQLWTQGKVQKDFNIVPDVLRGMWTCVLPSKSCSFEVSLLPDAYHSWGPGNLRFIDFMAQQTNSMKHSPWEISSCPASQNFSILWNLKVYYPVLKSSPLDSIMSQINPVHFLLLFSWRWFSGTFCEIWTISLYLSLH
jgi:hypothetical protein